MCLAQVNRSADVALKIRCRLGLEGNRFDNTGNASGVIRESNAVCNGAIPIEAHLAMQFFLKTTVYSFVGQVRSSLVR